MYSTSRVNLYQYDMQANDIGASRKTVAVYDGFLGDLGVFKTYFSFMELGADGRIFCRPPCGGCGSMHVLWHPEREGEATDMRQHYFYRDTFFLAGMPMLPNYRLGAVDGSQCDTIGFDNHPLAGYRYDRISGLYVDFTSVSWYEPETWYWDFGDPISGALNNSTDLHPDHIYSSEGYYSVCLTVCNQYGCDTLCKWVYVSESVDTKEPEFPILLENIKTYPNPVGVIGFENWEFPTLVTGRLVVFNNLGESVLIRDLKNLSTYRMDMERLAKGVYYWMFTENNGKRWSGKIIR
jgi:hypothetical protein